MSKCFGVEAIEQVSLGYCNSLQKIRNQAKLALMNGPALSHAKIARSLLRAVNVGDKPR
jgi:hypothetical protein